ncbi:hypothetical protein, partial [Methylomonas methanica]|uniref:hypothetical protein n=1 Tax=Methylomonas methanica TaxID=421 RepID=UPI001E410814
KHTVMNKIDYGRNCPLARYLEEVSMIDNGGRKAQFASTLLLGLGYPLYIKPPDNKFNAYLLRQIQEEKQNDLLSEVASICSHCPQSVHCEAGASFQVC